MENCTGWSLFAFVDWVDGFCWSILFSVTKLLPPLALWLSLSCLLLLLTLLCTLFWGVLRLLLMFWLLRSNDCRVISFWALSSNRWTSKFGAAVVVLVVWRFRSRLPSEPNNDDDSPAPVTVPNAGTKILRNNSATTECIIRSNWYRISRGAIIESKNWLNEKNKRRSAFLNRFSLIWIRSMERVRCWLALLVGLVGNKRESLLAALGGCGKTLCGACGLSTYKHKTESHRRCTMYDPIRKLPNFG